MLLVCGELWPRTQFVVTILVAECIDPVGGTNAALTLQTRVFDATPWIPMPHVITHFAASDRHFAACHRRFAEPDLSQPRPQRDVMHHFAASHRHFAGPHPALTAQSRVHRCTSSLSSCIPCISDTSEPRAQPDAAGSNPASHHSPPCKSSPLRRTSSITSPTQSGSDFSEPHPQRDVMHHDAASHRSLRRTHPALTAQSRAHRCMSSISSCIPGISDISEPRAYSDVAGSNLDTNASTGRKS